MATPPILLVEDNPDEAALALRALKKNNIAYDVILARDGVEALEYLLPATGNRCVPALVLLDLKLPRIDGLEVLRRIRADERTRLIPVVILTTSVEQEDLVQSYSRGCNSYLRKPVDFSEFTTTMQQVGRYWLTLNQLPPM